ncbi:MAG TPA: hypothetical protein VF317_07135, partial [Dermatophilaceae bacterium]
VAGQLRDLLERDRPRLEPVAVSVAVAMRDASLNLEQGVGEVYAEISVDRRNVIWDQWLGSPGVLL